MPLVCLGLLVLGLDGAVPRAGCGIGPPTARPGGRSRWGALGYVVPVLLGALVGLGVGVPVGTLVYWMAQSQHTTLPAAATLASATGSTVVLQRAREPAWRWPWPSRWRL